MRGKQPVPDWEQVVTRRGGRNRGCLTNMNIEETIRDWAKSGRIARGLCSEVVLMRVSTVLGEQMRLERRQYQSETVRATHPLV